MDGDAGFAAGLMLLLQLGALVDLADYLGNCKEGELEALVAEVQEMVMSRQLERRDEERLGLTMRVVREGMYLLYVLFILHSTRSLIRLAV